MFLYLPRLFIVWISDSFIHQDFEVLLSAMSKSGMARTQNILSRSGDGQRSRRVLPVDEQVDGLLAYNTEGVLSAGNVPGQSASRSAFNSLVSD